MADVRKKIGCKMAGPGGMKCQCCGPAPKDKAKFLRTAKRVDKHQSRKELKTQIDGVNDERS